MDRPGQTALRAMWARRPRLAPPRPLFRFKRQSACRANFCSLAQRQRNGFETNRLQGLHADVYAALCVLACQKKVLAQCWLVERTTVFSWAKCSGKLVRQGHSGHQAFEMGAVALPQLSGHVLSHSPNPSLKRNPNGDHPVASWKRSGLSPGSVPEPSLRSGTPWQMQGPLPSRARPRACPWPLGQEKCSGLWGWQGRACNQGLHWYLCFAWGCSK